MHCWASMLFIMVLSPTHSLTSTLHPINVFYLTCIPASTPTWNNTTFYADFSELPSQAELQQDWNQSYTQQDGHKKHCCFFVPGSQLALVLLTCCYKDLKPLQVPILNQTVEYVCSENVKVKNRWRKIKGICLPDFLPYPHSS